MLIFEVLNYVEHYWVSTDEVNLRDARKMVFLELSIEY
jgi:hypothetical protein